jgi:hypothetical protein
LSNQDYEYLSESLTNLINEEDFIYRIGSPKHSLSERLQLLIFKLILLLWEEDENESPEKMEYKLKLVDDIRHELTFLRSKYYKKVFSNKNGLKF